MVYVDKRCEIVAVSVFSFYSITGEYVPRPAISINTTVHQVSVNDHAALAIYFRSQI
jgi:hypothetical protein